MLSKVGQFYGIKVKVYLNIACIENNMSSEVNELRNIMALLISVATKMSKYISILPKVIVRTVHMDRAPNDLCNFHHNVSLSIAKYCLCC